MRKPEQLKTPDLKKLRDLCQEYIDFIDNDEKYEEDNDYDYRIFEKTMETIFGKNVWEFINNRRK